MIVWKCHLLYGPAPQSGGREHRVSCITSEDVELPNSWRKKRESWWPLTTIFPSTSQSLQRHFEPRLWSFPSGLTPKMEPNQTGNVTEHPTCTGTAPSWNFDSSFYDTGGHISPQKCVFWITSIITVSNTDSPAWRLDFITFLWKWPIMFTSQVHRRPKAVLQERMLRFCC